MAGKPNFKHSLAPGEHMVKGLLGQSWGPERGARAVGGEEGGSGPDMSVKK